MSNMAEYRSGETYLHNWGRDLHQQGIEGWEAIEARSNGDYGSSPKINYTLRRYYDGAGPWEYYIFYVVESCNPGWYYHITSCGWHVVETVTTYYQSTRSYYLAKRPHSPGKDHGDITEYLSQFGMGNCPQDRTIGDILRVKWVESEKAGYDIGTSQAVKYWMGSSVLPDLFKNYGIPRSNFSSIDLCQHILNLRNAISDKYPVTLQQAVEAWGRLQLKL